MHWMALQYIWDQKLSLDAIWLFFCQNMRNRHLNVWLEDLVEEPLNAGEDESRNEQNVWKVESELSYHRSLLLVKIGWEIFSHQVHCACKRFWPTTHGAPVGLRYLACLHTALPNMGMWELKCEHWESDVYDKPIQLGCQMTICIESSRWWHWQYDASVMIRPLQDQDCQTPDFAKSRGIRIFQDGIYPYKK